MRNLKKVLTLVLTLAMLLSVMVVGAGAATFGDQDSITNKEAVDVCTTLNIIGGYEDGTFRPAGNVTRAEMSKMICVALNGGKEPTMGSGLIATFNDVAKDNWAAPYIEYCVSQGIVGGVGGGNFNPNGNITGTQAAKMLLCILGYNASIQGYVGSDYWETNINVDAAQKGLYEGLTNIDASAPLTRDQAAQMIWNALNAYEVEYNTTLVTGPNGELTSKVTVQDKVVAETKDKITLLEDKYEAHIAIGTFAGNYDTGTTSKDGTIKITSAKIDGTGSNPYTFKSNLDLKYIGEEVKVLYRNGQDGDDDKLDEQDTIYGVYVTGNTTVYNIIKDDIQDVDTANSKVKFNDTKYNYDGSGDIYYNFVIPGSAPANFGTDIASLEKASGDTIKFIVDDTTGKIDTAYVMEYDIAEVTAVNSSKVSLSDIGTIDLEGNSIYDGIASGDIVVVSQLYDTVKADATFVVTKAETVSGTVKSFLDGEKVNIDGKTYFMDACQLTGTSMPDLTDNAILNFQNSNLENTATLYLINGFVGAADSDVTETYYGLVTAANDMDKVGHAISGAKVQLLTIDGKDIYDVDEDSKTVVDAASKTDAQWAKTLVKFSKVSDTSIEIKEVVATNVVIASGSKNIYQKDIKSLTTVVDGSNNPTTSTVVDADAVFFTSTSSSGDYSAYNLRDLGNIKTAATGGTTTLYFATDSDSGLVVAAFADLQVRPSGASTADKFGIVTAVEQNVKGSDNKYYNQYKVWTGETEDVTVLTTDTFAKGNLVYFEQTKDNIYSTGQIVNLASPTGNVSATPVLAVTYEGAGEIIRYKTTFDAATESAGSVADDVQIIYVDVADKAAGTGFGGKVPAFDKVTGYKNVMLVDADGDGTYDAIIVDDNNDILNRANSTGYTLTLDSSITTAPTTGSGRYVITVSQENAASLKQDQGITVTVTPTTAVSSNTDTVTIGGKNVTFTAADGLNAKTIKIVMPGSALTLNATITNA